MESFLLLLLTCLMVRRLLINCGILHAKHLDWSAAQGIVTHVKQVEVSVKESPGENVVLHIPTIQFSVDEDICVVTPSSGPADLAVGDTPIIYYNPANLNEYMVGNPDQMDRTLSIAVCFVIACLLDLVFAYPYYGMPS